MSNENKKERNREKVAYNKMSKSVKEVLPVEENEPSVTVEEIEPEVTETVVEEVVKEEPKVAPATKESFKAVVTADRLNVRKGPGLSYDADPIKLLNGQEVTIVDVKSDGENDWGFLEPTFKVKGWVMLSFVEKI